MYTPRGEWVTLSLSLFILLKNKMSNASLKKNKKQDHVIIANMKLKKKEKKKKERK